MNHSVSISRQALVLLCAAGVLASCKPADRPASPRTSETAAVSSSLENFKRDPSEENLKRVEADLAKLESEIRERDLQVSQLSGVEKSEARAKLDDLRAKDAAYRAEFAGARVGATVNKAGQAAENAVEATGAAARDAAQAVEETFQAKEKP